mgnify:CR=1 FL=1|jgi:hypothetical protein
MENASKALIIAGAILLAILLISLGIMIFNQAQDTVNNSGMSQAEITAFNNKFLKYEGDQDGSVVKSLVNEVIASNADDNNPDVKVNNSTNPSTSSISTTKKYTVTLSYNTAGRVDNITYTQK